MVTLEPVHKPTAAIIAPVDSLALTTSRTLPTTKPRREPKPSTWLRSTKEQTRREVDPAERGNEDERNKATSLEADHERNGKEPKHIEDGEGGRIRSELARDLIQRVNQLLPLVGDVSLATHVGLLKRDLSRGHDLLKDHPSESNFLSIVTLVESAMAQLKWKQYTNSQLEAIRQVLDMGYRQVRVSFNDYETARNLFSQKSVDATPRIDLDSLSLEDLTDDEEED
jgi:hypothetical protein